MQKDKLLIIYAGGTIGMVATPKGLAPSNAFADLLQQHLPPSARQALEPYQLLELPTPIDSANLVPAHWTELAALITQHHSSYAGLVLLHGTDTMAYTASALSFLLQGLSKPLVLTGSQIPLALPRSDAFNNLLQAAAFARTPNNQQVSICFDGLLLQGNRSTKIHSSALRAFDSPNAPVLGMAGIQTKLLQPYTCQQDFLPNTQPLTARIAQLLFYPGIDNAQIDAAIANPDIDGVILQTYGAGNPPDTNTHLLHRLEQAQQQGQILINISQCPGGSVAQGSYASGAVLNQLGVIQGADMTREAAFTKLHSLLAGGKSTHDIKTAIAQPLCRELTPG